MPRLILLNGAPAAGKSTLARRFVDEHPLSLMLDVDALRASLGRWEDDPMAAGLAARHLARAMASTHLSTGRDVIVPQFLRRPDFITQLEQVAREAGAAFIEVLLVSSPEEAEVRFVQRSEASSEELHRHARMLQEAPGAASVPQLYASMLAMAAARPQTRFVQALPGDIEGTWTRLQEALG